MIHSIEYLALDLPLLELKVLCFPRYLLETYQLIQELWLDEELYMTICI